MSDIAVKAEAPPPSLARRIVAFPLSLMLIAILVFALGGTIGTILIKLLPRHPDSPWLLVNAAIAILTMLPLLWLFFRYVERGPMTIYATDGWAKELLAGLAGGALLFSLMVAFVAVLGGYRIIGHDGLQSIWMPLAAYALIPAFAEELLFRGILFRYIEKAAGSWAALVITSALFGLAHIYNENATWFSSFAIMIEAGILLGAIYMLTRRLWAAMGVHAAWNFTQGWIFGLPVSGSPGGVGLNKGQLIGSDLLTGGAFGLEASVPAVVVATTAGIAILLVAVRRGRVIQPMWVSARAGAIPAGRSHTSPS
jgi:membrane protease YdiL (CAAX protease family)